MIFVYYNLFGIRNVFTHATLILYFSIYLWSGVSCRKQLDRKSSTYQLHALWATRHHCMRPHPLHQYTGGKKGEPNTAQNPGSVSRARASVVVQPPQCCLLYDLFFPRHTEMVAGQTLLQVLQRQLQEILLLTHSREARIRQRLAALFNSGQEYVSAT